MADIEKIENEDFKRYFLLKEGLELESFKGEADLLEEMYPDFPKRRVEEQKQIVSDIINLGRFGA